MAKVREITIAAKDRIDVKGGRHSYGQQIELRRVLENENLTDPQRIRELIKTLHPKSSPAINIENVRYAKLIDEGVRFWCEQENEKLHYAATSEEKQAGSEELARVTGAIGVAVSLAEKFGKHPDDVFNWEYGTVFSILFVDLERYKYAKRLDKIRENKRQQESKRR